MRRIVPARLLAVISLGLTVAAVARAGDLEGRSGPIAWRATDVQQNTTTVDGKRHARHEFALTAKNAGTQPLSLSAYEAAISYFGVQMSEMAGLLQVTLVILTGRAENNTAFTAPPIDVTLPTDANVPVVRRNRVLVTRVPSGSDPTRVPATFKPGVILVPASVNGKDVTLLLDTGAQICVLNPEVARRLGIAVPSDAPLLPLIGIGSGGGPLVQLPPLRVGDYVVEHLSAAVTSLSGFPFAIDGVLGTNFIEAFRVTIDHRAKELRLEAR